MKRKNGSARGFTLIELLVVITIIGLLAAVLVPAVTKALNSAKKTRAMRQVADLDSAIKQFYKDYNRMPVPAGDNGGSDKIYLDADQAKVIEILINSPYSTETNANPKQIVYLDLDPSAFGVKTVAEMLDALKTKKMPYKDPWGKGYGIMMDLNFDEKIQSLKNFPEIKAKVAVFSVGENGDDKNPAANPPFKTW